MTYEERLKKLLGNNDPFWYTTIDNFVRTTYEDKEQAISDLENLAKDNAKFNEFTKQIIQRKDNLKSVKEEFLNFQFLRFQLQKILILKMEKTMIYCLNWQQNMEPLILPTVLRQIEDLLI